MRKKPKPRSKEEEKFFADLTIKNNIHIKHMMECIEKWLNNKERLNTSVL
jgi:hypothetical protein